LNFTHLGRRRKFLCKYLSYQNKAGNWLRLPLIRVDLRNGDEAMSTVALIDSGATASFIPYEIAVDILGLEAVQDDVPVTGAGSTFPNMLMNIYGITIKKGVDAFCQLEDVLVHVPKPPAEIPYCILGRDTIFRLYEITFRENEGKFLLKRA